MQDELISVLVPVYNTKNLLGQCVESICGQTHKNLEIILVDDGSTDGSDVACDEFAQNDSRIVVVHKENGGLPSARRAGLMKATSNYVAFVDSDDWIEQDMIESLWRALFQNDADISVGRQFLDIGGTSHIEAERSALNGCLNADEIAHHIIYSDDYKKRGISPSFCDKLFKKEIIAKHQYNLDLKTKFAEDDICVYGALLDAKVVALVDKPVYHYCRREDSMTAYADTYYFEKITLFYHQMKNVFESHSESELLMQKLNRYMIEFVLRGVNKTFGFGFGNVIPFFIPPYHKLQELNARNIVIYGAGDVGKDYYHGLRQSGYNVVAWADKRGGYLADHGFNTVAPEKIRDISYDILLVAADSADLMNQMKTMLINEIGVDPKKIVDEYPLKFIEELP